MRDKKKEKVGRKKDTSPLHFACPYSNELCLHSDQQDSLVTIHLRSLIDSLFCPPFLFATEAKKNLNCPGWSFALVLVQREIERNKSEKYKYILSSNSGRNFPI
jgi:hypothetical protein